MREAIGRRVLLGVFVLALTVPSAASGHESEWCGHSQLRGNYWELTYLGYRDEPAHGGTGGHQAREHRHYVNHRYRSSGSQHERSHHCGYVRGSSDAVPPATIHFPELPVDPTDLPDALGHCCAQAVALEPGVSTDPALPAIVLAAVPIDGPRPGDCFVGVTRDSGGGAIVEYAQPAIAERLGHTSGC